MCVVWQLAAPIDATRDEPRKGSGRVLRTCMRIWSRFHSMMGIECGTHRSHGRNGRSERI